IRYYEQALKLDPNYALAYCGLADTYAYMGGVMMPSKEAVAKEKEFAQRSLELDPELPEAHLSLACAFGGVFDWRNAQIEFDRAIELNPNLAWAYEIYGWFLCGLGRLDEVIAKDKTAIRQYDSVRRHPSGTWRKGESFGLAGKILSRPGERLLVSEG